MRHVVMLVAMAAFWCSLVSIGAAEEPKATKATVSRQVQSKADAPPTVNLRAQIHRTVANLIEERSVESPDQTKIDALVKKLQELRDKLQTEARSVTGPGTWNCPCGGRAMGYGRGPAWGGPGRGAGAFDPGVGRGWGGAGRGRGPGGGLGLAPGGPAFVDEDHDGICDRYEIRHAMPK